MAVNQLVAGTVAADHLVLTGPRAVTPHEIASLLSAALKRPVELAVRSPLVPAAGDDFEHRAVAQFMTLIAEGRASATTDVVETLLGRPPLTVESFIHESLVADTAVSGSYS